MKFSTLWAFFRPVKVGMTPFGQKFKLWIYVFYQWNTAKQKTLGLGTPLDSNYGIENADFRHLLRHLLQVVQHIRKNISLNKTLRSEQIFLTPERWSIALLIWCENRNYSRISYIFGANFPHSKTPCSSRPNDLYRRVCLVEYYQNLSRKVQIFFWNNGGF